MPRSVKKGPFIDGHLAEKVAEAVKTNSRKVIKTWSRRSTVWSIRCTSASGRT